MAAEDLGRLPEKLQRGGASADLHDGRRRPMAFSETRVFAFTAPGVLAKT